MTDYYFSDSDKDLYRVDPATLAETKVGELPVVMTDIAIAPNGDMYGITMSNLYLINPDTAEAVLVLRHGLAGANALAFDPTGQAYIASTSNAGVHKLNIKTGAVALFGQGTSNLKSAGDLAFHAGQILFSTRSNELVTLNAETGAFVRKVPHAISDLFGLISNGKTVYAFAGSEAYIINPVTGASTLVKDYPSSTVNAIFGSASTDFGQTGSFYRGTGNADSLTGTGRDDIFSCFAGNDVVRGYAGRDFVSCGLGNDRVYAGSGNDIAAGDGGADILKGEGGNDLLRGGAQNDTLYGGSGTDRLYGDSGNDILRGEDGADVLYGGAGNDRIYGGNQNDKIDGEAGNDLLFGDTGNDVIIGGTGRDTMSGGAGADDFIFKSVVDAGRASTRDVIRDFATGLDDIDLRAIDANGSAAGNAAFVFLIAEGAAFTGARGQLRWDKQGSLTLIEGDLDGNRLADFQIELTGAKSLTPADFLL